MAEWIDGVLIVIAAFAVGAFVLRAIVERVGRLAARASRATLKALSTGGVSLLSADPEADFQGAPARRPRNVRKRVLDALATGGLSLLYSDAPNRHSGGWGADDDHEASSGPAAPA